MKHFIGPFYPSHSIQSQSELIYQINFLQESEKGQISYWSIQTCTRIMLLFGGLSPCSKNLKTALFQTFSTYTQILSALTAFYTDLVPPSTDPVHPSTN